ncbi:ParB/RepB/Spo0J family partition protein [Marinobacter nauticus]|uniref:ParB/RepB/Spo0J family partition protein n=1 Tax=Marinobacter nauticus TaxID=2743 RepID=UPI001C99BE70|nr:ParB/RepB/Spo0J family partition protein [Marinobacter nauticus]MBY5963598.1 ParB/RepB/Spo0J family partition protein [Marinobacter nauticus]
MVKPNKYGNIDELLPGGGEETDSSSSTRKRRRPSPALGAMQGERRPISVTESLKEEKAKAERALEEATSKFEEEKQELLRLLESKESEEKGKPIVLTMPVTQQEVVFELQRIDPSKIDVSPENERIQEFLDEISLRDILPSIRKQGQQFPGTVRPKKDGRFELIEGSRRLKAAVLAKKPYLALVGDVPDADVRELSVIENKHQDVSYFEKAKAWERQINDGEFANWTQLGAAKGISSSNINRYKACVELDEKFVRILPSPSDMPLSYGEMISKLRKKNERSLLAKVEELLELRKESMKEGGESLGVEEVIKALKSSVRVRQAQPKAKAPVLYKSPEGDRFLKHGITNKGTTKFEIDGADEESLSKIVEFLTKTLGVELNESN